MNNTTVLRGVRDALKLEDGPVAEIFGLGGQPMTAEQAGALMSAGDEQPCSSELLAAFLDGLIVSRRGPREGAAPEPSAPPRLTNNVVFKKLRIALNLHEDELLKILAQGGLELTGRSLRPLFRKPRHKHHKKCSDETLQAFLEGLALRPAG